MSRLFRICPCNDPQAAGGEKFCIGIPLSIAGRETVIPVSDSCHTFEEMVRSAGDIQNDLKLLLKEAQGIFQPETQSEAGFHFPPEMKPDKVWAVLNEMVEEEAFIKAFNQLDEERRGRVAEHVLTRCNVFSGNAAVFSARYNSVTGLLD
jgi:hypothetical protein